MNLFCGERNLVYPTNMFLFLWDCLLCILCWLGCVNEKAP
jgi:hypothetical protein